MRRGYPVQVGSLGNWYDAPVRGVFLALLASACSSAPPELIVDVRTDLVPGSEIVALQLDLDDGQSASTVVDTTVDWFEGGRLARLEVSRGPRVLTVMALGPDETPLVQRRVRVDVGEDLGVTVLLTRDCRGVRCDAPGAEACRAGRCVGLDCIEQALESCGEPECATELDCPAASSCGSVACEAGACVYRSGDSCDAGEYCDPEFGCRSIDPSEPSGLVLHIACDDDPTDGVEDSAGDRDGSCEECPELRSGGPRGSYYVTDGDQIVIPTDEGLHLPAFTVAVWVRSDLPVGEGQRFQSAFSKPFGSGTDNSWELTSELSVPSFVTFGETFDSLSATDPFAVGEWTHMAGSFDGTTKRFYLDGAAVASTPLFDPIDYDANPILICSDLNNDVVSSLFVGGIDDVRLYDRALSATEIATLATP